MKVRYAFAARGRLKFPDDLAFEYRGRFYTFGARDGFVSEIAVTIDVPNRNHWPTVTNNPSPGVAAHIHFREPQISFVQLEVRQLGALLALYGLTSVDVDNPKIRWLPQSDSEKEALPIRSFQRSFGRVDPTKLPTLPTDVMARCLIAAFRACVADVPLMFFRRGREDMLERRFIEACYHFYFVFETLFGEGKYNSKAVKAAFRKAPDLQRAISAFMKDAPVHTWLQREFPSKYGKVLAPAASEAVSDYLVEFRGFIHHHTARRRGIWHPDRQEEFEFEATIFQGVAYECVSDLATRAMFDPALDLDSIRLMKRKR